MVSTIQLANELYDVAWAGEPNVYRDKTTTQAFETILTEDRIEAFRDIDIDDEWFLVRIDGDSPLSGTFGRIVWARESDDTRRVNFVIVSGEVDDRPATGEPARRNVRRTTLRTRAGLDALLAELQTAGVLADDALTRITARMNAAPDNDWLDLAEVRDTSPYRSY